MPSKLLITLHDISVSFDYTLCFEHFSTSIYLGNRIAVTGNNGTGKSSLLNILAQNTLPTSGFIQQANQVQTAYIPQIISTTHSLSGGERFNHALTQALQKKPDILILDEPTNHLDSNNRRSLFKLLHHFKGAVICASHDKELLSNFNDFWNIHQQSVDIFHGSYSNYLTERQQQHSLLTATLKQLTKEEQKLHGALMKEQQRAAKSKKHGHKKIDQRKWPTVTSKTKATRANTKGVNNQAAILESKTDIHEKISNLSMPKMIRPRYTLNPLYKQLRCILNINDGSAGYINKQHLIKDIYLTMQSNERIAITGSNGSGKSTILKAMINHNGVIKHGKWHTPKTIGYLDQHYATLTEPTVIATIQTVQPHWNDAQVRTHLNDFLFSKTEQVNQLTSTLSGGGKLRLCLAQIAAHPPELLILDEITNNIDQETFEHIVNILTPYPGALIIVSHDDKFIKMLNIEARYITKNGTLQRE